MINEEAIKLIESFMKDNYNQFSVVLDQREKAILVLRSQNKTLQSIGDKMGITRERVRQLEGQAKQRIGKGRELAIKIYDIIKNYLFEDSEVEAAFLKWYSNKINPNFQMAKLDWQVLLKTLWEQKQNEDKNKSN